METNPLSSTAELLFERNYVNHFHKYLNKYKFKIKIDQAILKWQHTEQKIARES